LDQRLIGESIQDVAFAEEGDAPLDFFEKELLSDKNRPPTSPFDAPFPLALQSTRWAAKTPGVYRDRTLLPSQK
jgi:hypothetical protein